MCGVTQKYLSNAKKETCHNGMTVELRSKKVLVPLEVKKKRIKEKLPLTKNEEESRDEEKNTI
jgi:hypothetical protein